MSVTNAFVCVVLLLVMYYHQFNIMPFLLAVAMRVIIKYIKDTDYLIVI